MIACAACAAESVGLCWVELDGAVGEPEGPLCHACGAEFAVHVEREHPQRAVLVHHYGYEGSLTPARLAWARRSSDLERADNPPAWVADEALWEQAKRRVRPHWAEYRQPYAVVVHVYQQMGGAFR